MKIQKKKKKKTHHNKERRITTNNSKFFSRLFQNSQRTRILTCNYEGEKKNRISDKATVNRYTEKKIAQKCLFFFLSLNKQFFLHQ